MGLALVMAFVVADDVRKHHGAARTYLILGGFSTMHARTLHVS